jgi:glycosyltransferase involved in cell wall biosynthesis
MITRSVSIVVPVYNSEESLPILVHRLDQIRESVASQLEAVLINDGSRDRSAMVMDDLAKRYSWVGAISLLRNYGQHNALLCGIRGAENEIIVTMDDDLQNPPEEIPKLLAKLHDGNDVVYGHPETGKPRIYAKSRVNHH